MKKISIYVSLMLCGVVSFAQEASTTAPAATEKAAPADDFKSKNGFTIRPEAGEFGLGFNAVPFLNYLGNALNGANNNNVAAGSRFVNSDNVIYGKYMLDAKTAIRARVRITDNITTNRNLVVEDGQLDPEVKVEDMMKTNTNGVTLGAGYEKRRGQGRLQGVYGGEALFFTGKTSTQYEYGNAMEKSNINPTTTNFGGNIVDASNRVLSVNNGRNFGLGANAFAGLEYFVAPKVALGAEFNWGITYFKGGSAETVTESFTTEVETKTNENKGVTTFGLDTGAAAGGAISVMFYF